MISGSRIKTSLDFGLVKLDIDSIRSSDVGIYTCKAVNLNGEATSTTSIKVQGEYMKKGVLKFFHKRQKDVFYDIYKTNISYSIQT